MGISLENFPIGAGSSPLVVLHIRTNYIERMLLELIEGDYAVLGKALKEVGARMFTGIALAPAKLVNREGQQAAKVWRRFGKVWALVCDYEGIFSTDRFCPRACSTTANTSVGLIYKISLKETPGKGWGALVKTQGSAWVRGKLNNQDKSGHSSAERNVTE